MALGGLALWHPHAQAAAHRAALVIQHGPSWPGTRLIYKCVEFGQAAISGLALLELAGATSGQPPQVYDWGGGALTVCQLNGEPRQVPQKCFGPVSGPNWSDWQTTAAGWTPRSSGVNGYSVHDGDLEGWTYAVGYGTRPPAVTFSQVCPPPAAASASIVRSTAQPARSSSAPLPAAAITHAPTPPPSTAPVPSELALAPSVQPTTASRAAGDAAPVGRGSPPTWPLVASTLAILSALFVWNLRRRRG